MKWNGDYHIKCPKCKNREIIVQEHCDAYSEHLIKNGFWDPQYNANEYGNYTFTTYKCTECGHVWKFNGTMDKYLIKK